MSNWDEVDAVKAWKTLRGARLDARAKRYIHDRVHSGALSGISWDAIRAAMDAYAATVEQSPLPVAPFWADPLKWMPRDLPIDALERSGGYPTIGKTPRNAQRPASASAPTPSVDVGVPVSDLISRWNAICPSAPATERIAQTADWAGCGTLREMVAAWNDVAAKTQAVRESASDAGWLTLPFLLRTKDGMAKANWERLMAGDFDPRERRGGKEDVRGALNEWLEAIDAVEREWLDLAEKSAGANEERRRKLAENRRQRESQADAYQREIEERRQRFMAQHRDQYVRDVVLYGQSSGSLTQVFKSDPIAAEMIKQELTARALKGTIQ